MHARFELELGEHTLAGNGGDDFLVTTGIALAGRNQLDPPAFFGSIALIHAEQVTGEQCCLQTARTGTNFENGVLLVGSVLRQ